MPTPLLLMSVLGCALGAQGGSDVPHGVAATAARDAVIAGNVETLKEAAQQLRSSLSSPDAEVVAALDALDASRDTTMGGEALGTMVGTCAACHTQVGVVPTLSASEAKAADGAIAAAMVAHFQGAEEMWAGLVLADLERIQKGAALVASSNLAPTGTPVGSPVSPLATEQEVGVQDLADRASRAEDLAVAASAYGRMLGRCSACHAVTGGGPEPKE